MGEVIAAAITAILGLVGVIITNNASNKKMLQQSQTAQAVTDTRLDDLTREVRAHNAFAQRIPALEAKMESVEKRIEFWEKQHR